MHIQSLLLNFQCSNPPNNQRNYLFSITSTFNCLFPSSLPFPSKTNYFQEGSIGSDLVIRPLPPRLHSQPPKENDAKILPDDDEMFLDDDGELSSEVAIDTGLPIKRNTEHIQSHQHIVYKRKNPQEDTLSDYGTRSNLALEHK